MKARKKRTSAKADAGARGAKTCTSDQSTQDEQVTHAVELLAEGWRSGEVNKALRELWGISHRTAQKRINEAHEVNKAEGAAQREDIRNDNLAKYRRIHRLALADGQFSAATKALERVDKLFGTETAQKVEVEVTNPSDSYWASLTDEQRAMLGEACPE